MTYEQWKPVQCSYCGVVMRQESEQAMAFNMGAGIERFCYTCSPPSEDPADAIKLMETFMRVNP